MNLWANQAVLQLAGGMVGGLEGLEWPLSYIGQNEQGKLAMCLCPSRRLVWAHVVIVLGFSGVLFKSLLVPHLPVPTGQSKSHDHTQIAMWRERVYLWVGDVYALEMGMLTGMGWEGFGANFLIYHTPPPQMKRARIF